MGGEEGSRAEARRRRGRGRRFGVAVASLALAGGAECGAHFEGLAEGGLARGGGRGIQRL